MLSSYRIHLLCMQKDTHPHLTQIQQKLYFLCSFRKPNTASLERVTGFKLYTKLHAINVLIYLGKFCYQSSSLCNPYHLAQHSLPDPDMSLLVRSRWNTGIQDGLGMFLDILARPPQATPQQTGTGCILHPQNNQCPLIDKYHIL